MVNTCYGKMVNIVIGDNLSIRVMLSNPKVTWKNYTLITVKYESTSKIFFT